MTARQTFGIEPEKTAAQTYLANKARLFQFKHLFDEAEYDRLMSDFMVGLVEVRVHDDGITLMRKPAT